MSDGLNQEFLRSREERRRLREMDQRMRLEAERQVRLVLDDHFPAGVPEDLLERICKIQNGLIWKIVQGEKATRELHDGINRISDEAAQREVQGYNLCAEQVRAHAEELGLDNAVTDSLLRNHVSMQEADQAERNRAATQQVEWSRT